MSDNIHVAIRVRPLIAREIRDEAQIYWQVKDSSIIYQVDKNGSAIHSSYCFDRVFDSEENNEIVYRELCCPIVESIMQGFNGTIFAYGQTSSGKTYTMMGDRKNAGIIRNTISDIFNAIDNMPFCEFLLRVSYMEIYNEMVSDLLSQTEKKNLKIQEDTDGLISVCGLEEVVIHNADEILSLMKKGEKKRHIGETNMNERSSRSHTIFRMIIESRMMDTDTDEAVKVSQLNLVDLAGSERAGQMGITGERFKEGVHINKSLMMLGHVISQLSEGDGPYISYRDSKLTRILQNSLGGNARTAIICTVTPASLEQTHSTLKFASRAKCIKNKPTVNEVLTDKALLKRYAVMIKNLSEALEQLQQEKCFGDVKAMEQELEEKSQQNLELERRLKELKEKLVVSHYAPQPTVALNKKARRETWGGPLLKSRMSCMPSSTFKGSFSSLAVVYEEALTPTFFNSLLESDSHVLNSSPAENMQSFGLLPGILEDDLLSFEKRNFSDNFSFSPIHVTYRETKKVSSTKSNKEISLEAKGFYLTPSPGRLNKKLKLLTEELKKTTMEKSEIEKNLKELEEFTTLERQIFQVESQQFKEIKDLKKHIEELKREKEEYCLQLEINCEQRKKREAELCTQLQEAYNSLDAYELNNKREIFLTSRNYEEQPNSQITLVADRNERLGLSEECKNATQTTQSSGSIGNVKFTKLFETYQSCLVNSDEEILPSCKDNLTDSKNKQEMLNSSSILLQKNLNNIFKSDEFSCPTSTTDLRVFSELRQPELSGQMINVTAQEINSSPLVTMLQISKQIKTFTSKSSESFGFYKNTICTSFKKNSHYYSVGDVSSHLEYSFDGFRKEYFKGKEFSEIYSFQGEKEDLNKAAALGIQYMQNNSNVNSFYINKLKSKANDVISCSEWKLFTSLNMLKKINSCLAEKLENDVTIVIESLLLEKDILTDLDEKQIIGQNLICRADLESENKELISSFKRDSQIYKKLYQLESKLRADVETEWKATIAEITNTLLNIKEYILNKLQTLLTISELLEHDHFISDTDDLVTFKITHEIEELKFLINVDKENFETNKINAQELLDLCELNSKLKEENARLIQALDTKGNEEEVLKEKMQQQLDEKDQDIALCSYLTVNCKEKDEKIAYLNSHYDEVSISEQSIHSETEQDLVHENKSKNLKNIKTLPELNLKVNEEKAMLLEMLETENEQNVCKSHLEQLVEKDKEISSLNLKLEKYKEMYCVKNVDVSNLKEELDENLTIIPNLKKFERGKQDLYINDQVYTKHFKGDNIDLTELSLKNSEKKTVLSAVTESKTNENNVLEGHIEELRKQNQTIAKLKDKLEECKQKLCEKEKLISDVNKKCEESRVLIANLEEQSQEKKDLSLIFEAKLEKCEETIKKLQELNLELTHKKTLHSEPSEVKISQSLFKHHIDELDKKNEEISSLTQKIKEYEQKFIEKKAEVTSINNQLNNNSETTSELKKLVEERQSCLKQETFNKNEEIKRLTELNLRLNQEKAMLLEVLETTNNEPSECRDHAEQLDEKNVEILSLNFKLEEHKKMLSEKDDHITLMNKQLLESASVIADLQQQTYEKELCLKHETEIKNWEDTVNKLTELNLKLDEEKAMLIAASKAQNEERNSCKDYVEQLNIKDQEIMLLNGELANYKGSGTEEYENLSHLNKKLVETLSVVAELKMELETEKELNIKHNEEKIKLFEVLENKTHEQNEYKEQLNEKDWKISSFDFELQEQKKILHEKNENISEANEQLLQSASLVSDLQQQIEEKEMHLKKYETEIKNWEETVNELTELNLKLNEEKTVLTAASKTQNDELISCKEYLEQLNIKDQEIVLLNSQLANYKDIYSRNSENTANLNKKLDETLCIVAELKMQCEIEKEINVRFNEEKIMLLDTLENERYEHKDHIEQLHEKQGNFLSLTETVKEYEQKLTKKDAEVTSINKQLIENSETISELKKLVEERQSCPKQETFNKNMEEIKRLTELNLRLNQEKAMLLEVLETTNNEPSECRDHAEQLDEKNVEISSLNFKLEEHKKMLSEKDDHITLMNKQLLESASVIADLQQQTYEKELCLKHETEIKNWEDTVNKLTELNLKLDEEKAMLIAASKAQNEERNSCKDYVEQLNIKDQEIMLLNGELANYKGSGTEEYENLSHLNKKLVETLSVVAELKMELETEKELNIKHNEEKIKLFEVLENKTHEQNEYKEQLNEKDLKISSFDFELQEHKKILHEKNEHISEANEQLLQSASLVSDLQQQIEEKEMHLKKYETEIKNWEETVNELTELNLKLDEEKTVLIAASKIQNDELISCKEHVEQLNIKDQEIVLLNSQLANYKDIYSKNSENIADLNKKLDETLSIVAVFKRRYETEKELNVRFNEEKIKLHEVLEDITYEKNECKEQLNEKNMEISSLDYKLEEHKNMLTEKNEYIISINKQLLESASINADVQQKLEEKELCLKKLEAEMKNFEETINRLIELNFELDKEKAMLTAVLDTKNEEQNLYERHMEELNVKDQEIVLLSRQLTDCKDNCSKKEEKVEYLNKLLDETATAMAEFKKSSEIEEELHSMHEKNLKYLENIETLNELNLKLNEEKVILLEALKTKRNEENELKEKLKEFKENALEFSSLNHKLEEYEKMLVENEAKINNISQQLGKSLAIIVALKSQAQEEKKINLKFKDETIISDDSLETQTRYTVETGQHNDVENIISSINDDLIEEYKEILSEKNANICYLNKQLNETVTLIAQFEKQIETERELRIKYEEHAKSLEQDMTKITMDCHSKFDEIKSDLLKEKTAEIKNICQKYETNINELIMQHNSELEQKVNYIKNTEEKGNQQLADLTRKHEQEKKDMEIKLHEMMELKVSDLRKKNEDSKHAEIKTLEQQLCKFYKSQTKDKILVLSKEHEIELCELEKRLVEEQDKIMNDKIAELLKQKNNEIENLTQQHAVALLECKGNLLKGINVEMTQLKCDLSKKQEELNSLKSQYKIVLSNQKHEAKEYQEEMRKQVNDYTFRLHAELSEKRNELKSFKLHYEAMVKEKEMELHRQDDILNECKELLLTEMKSSIEKINSELFGENKMDSLISSRETEARKLENMTNEKQYTLLKEFKEEILKSLDRFAQQMKLEMNEKQQELDSLRTHCKTMKKEKIKLVEAYNLKINQHCVEFQTENYNKIEQLKKDHAAALEKNYNSFTKEKQNLLDKISTLETLQNVDILKNTSSSSCTDNSVEVQKAAERDEDSRKFFKTEAINSLEKIEMNEVAQVVPNETRKPITTDHHNDVKWKASSCVNNDVHSYSLSLAGIRQQLLSEKNRNKELQEGQEIYKQKVSLLKKEIRRLQEEKLNTTIKSETSKDKCKDYSHGSTDDVGTSGGSGVVNSVKVFWLEAQLYQKDKEIANFKKENVKLKSLLSSVKSKKRLATQSEKKENSAPNSITPENGANIPLPSNNHIPKQSEPKDGSSDTGSSHFLSHHGTRQHILPETEIEKQAVSSHQYSYRPFKTPQYSQSDQCKQQ